MIIIRSSTAFFLALVLCGQALGQTQPATVRAPEVRTPAAATPVQIENGGAVPQVVTILHGLNGLKVIRLLLRGNEELSSIASLDDAFQLAGEVHTNVIAGLALNDGQTIAAWLPEAEAELPPPMPAPPLAPSAPGSVTPASQPAPDTKFFKSFPRVTFQRAVSPADVKIVTRDGKNLIGHYVGLDGTTGLSVITLSESSLPKGSDVNVETIKAGQRVRLIGPEPVIETENNSRSNVYFRVGETEALVTEVTRAPSQTLARVKIKSPRISAANIGAVAVDLAGEPLGIVNAVSGDEATIVPVGIVRNAAKRVMERQASVPRPWLGVRGEPIGKLALDRIMKVGWQAERARALAEKQQGIFLTSVAPGSPAARAALMPGDVILSVNDELIQNADDFSLLLQEATPGASVDFLVARPGKAFSESFKIKLAESPDPSFGFGFGMFDMHMPMPSFGPMMLQGIEAIAIKPKVAARLGANGGLLVVYVQPTTVAYTAGLRPGDVIESVNGEAIVTKTSAGLVNKRSNTTYVVVRNKKRLTIAVPASNQ